MKVIFALLLAVAAVSATSTPQSHHNDDDLIKITTEPSPAEIEQLERLSQELTDAKKAIDEELREVRRSSSSPSPVVPTSELPRHDKPVRDRKCDVFACINKLTAFNATAERIDTESILASINAGRLDAPSKIVVASCRKFNDFNKCLGGDWLDCFDKETVVDVINKIFKAMPIPAIQDMKITPSQLEDMSNFVIEFCSRVEEIPKIDFQQCQLDAIARNERLSADFHYLAQFDFDACPSVSCDFARRLSNLLTHSSQVVCGDDAAALTFALSRAAANSFVLPSDMERIQIEQLMRERSTQSPRRQSRDTCDITESDLSTMKEYIRSIKRDQDDLLSIVRRRDDKSHSKKPSCRRDEEDSSEEDKKRPSKKSDKKSSKKDRKDSSEEDARLSHKKSSKKYSKKSSDESGESSEEERRIRKDRKDNKDKKNVKIVDRKGRVIVKKSKDNSGESSEELKKHSKVSKKDSKKSSKKSSEESGESSEEERRVRKDKKDRKDRKDKKSSKKDKKSKKSKKHDREDKESSRKDKRDEVDVDDEEMLSQISGRFTPKYFIAKKSFEKIVVAERRGGRRDDKKVDFEQFLRDISSIHRSPEHPESDDDEEESKESRRVPSARPHVRRSAKVIYVKKAEASRARRLSKSGKHDLEKVLSQLSSRRDDDEDIDVSHEKSKYLKKSSKKHSKKVSKKDSKKSSKKTEDEEESREEERRTRKDKKDRKDKKSSKKDSKKDKKNKKDKKSRRYPSKSERESKKFRKY